MKKVRLDQWLCDRGLFETRNKAQAAIMAGEVLVNETPVTKSGTMIAEDAAVRVKEVSPYVGRGAYKLIHALDAFGLDPKGKVGIDVGASTGGFTQVLLERGAVKVYAVDSGTNQLDWKLRSDPRVVAMENTNARYLKGEDFNPRPEVAAMDVSFISVTRILPALVNIMAPGFWIAVLIKPQFELSPELVGDRGLVDPKYHEQAIASVLSCVRELGLTSTEVIPSPITGAKSGNQEFLAAFSASRITPGI